MERITPLFWGLLTFAPAIAWAQPSIEIEPAVSIDDAHEGTDVAAAARAFAHAQAAELRGAHEEAAGLYELAFHVAPTPEALRSAVREWHRAGVRARAATLAERLVDRYGDDRLAGEIARVVLADVRRDLARFRIDCEPACSIAIDGRAGNLQREERHIGYVEPGAHQLEALWPDGRNERHEATLEAGSDLELTMSQPAIEEPRPAPPPPPIQPPRDPLALVPFSVALTGTIALAAATIALGIDVEIAADRYREMPTPEGYRDGLDRELRTNVFAAATAAAALATAIIAIVTDWDGPDVEQAWLRPAVTPQLAALELGVVLP